MKKTISLRLENEILKRSIIASVSNERLNILIMDESKTIISYDFSIEEAEELSSFINKNFLFPESLESENV